MTLAGFHRLAQSLTEHSQLLELASHQATGPYGRSAKSSGLSILVSLLFRPTEALKYGIEQDDLESDTDHRKARVTITIIARGLGLISGPDQNIAKTADQPDSQSPAKSICSRHTSCSICGGPLKSTSQPQGVWLVDLGQPSRGVSVRSDCSEPACRARHHADTTSIKHDGHRVLIYDSCAIYVKAGRDVFVHRDVARAFAVLLETSHVSSAAYAKAYSSSRATAGFTLQADHVWRAFVLHSTLEIAEELGEPFVTEQGAPLSVIVELVLAQYMSSRVIPEAAEHRCPECARYKRTWRTGAVRAGVALLEGDDVEDELADAKPSYRAHVNFKEDTTVDRSKVVTLSVMDGIQHLTHKVRTSPVS